MKVELELIRNETRRIEVEASSLRDAIEKAKLLQAVPEGFEIESATALEDGDDVEEGDSQLYMGICENCEIVLLEDDDYVTDGEGCRFCETCHTEFVAHEYP